MDFPSDVKFSKDHEWIKIGPDNTGLVGVSSFAIEQLGDIVFLELPAVGKTYSSGAPFGTIESTKTVSDLYMPMTAEVVERNEAMLKNPEKLQTDAFNEGWLLKVKISKPEEQSSLLDTTAYQKYLQES